MAIKIIYTKDGTTPNPDSVPPHGTVINGMVGTTTVTSGQTLKAVAFEDGSTKSQVQSEHYTTAPRCATPTFNPVAGEYSDYPKTIQISTATVGAQLRYTINDENVENGTIIPNTHGPVVVSAGDTLRAIAQKVGLVDSLVATGNYTNPILTVNEPTLTPDGGSFGQHTITVTLQCTTPNATITYTVGPSSDPPPDPTHNDVHHRDGDQFSLGLGHKTVKVLAFRSDMDDSVIHEADFDFDPSGGT